MILWYNVINVFYCIRSNLSTEQFNLTRMKWKFSCDFSLTVSIRQHWTFWLKKVMNYICKSWYIGQMIIFLQFICPKVWPTTDFSPPSEVQGGWRIRFEYLKLSSIKDCKLIIWYLPGNNDHVLMQTLDNIIDIFDRFYRSAGDKA